MNKTWKYEYDCVKKIWHEINYGKQDFSRPEEVIILWETQTFTIFEYLGLAVWTDTKELPIELELYLIQ